MTFRAFIVGEKVETWSIEKRRIVLSFEHETKKSLRWKACSEVSTTCINDQMVASAGQRANRSVCGNVASCKGLEQVKSDRQRS
jgi:hypothetical protein